MIRVAVRGGEDGAARAASPRRRFGLDAPLPADPWVVERAVLRHLATERPGVLVLALSRAPKRNGPTAEGRVDPASGVPELLLLLPGGRLVFLAIKTQARDLTRAERAFADLCRAQGVPVHVVRSLPEARTILDGLGLPLRMETVDAVEKAGLARRSGAGRP